MKKYNFLILLTISLLMSACGPTTKLLSSWTNENQTEHQFEKLAVAAIFPDNSNRYLTERALVDKLKENNISAIPTYEIFPLAGRVSEIQSLVNDSEALRERVKQKVVENKIDGLIIITLFNLETEQRFVNDRDFSMGGTGYYGNMYATGAYYNYYAYSIGTIYNNGYYVEDVTYFLECNLYDVATEELLWTGRTKTSDLESVEEEAVYFSDLIVRELLKDNVILTE